MASGMRAVAKQTLGAATRAVPPKVAERASPLIKSYLHSDEHWLLSERCHRCFFVSLWHPCPLRRFAPAPPEGATTTTAASGGNRESLLGQRPARRKRSAADAGSRNPGAEHLWRVGQAHAGRAKFLYIKNRSALLQRAAASKQYPCQAAASLGSRALFFALY